MALRPVRAASGNDEAVAAVRPVPEEVSRLIAALPMAALVVNSRADVVRSTPRAEALGLVRREALAVGEILDLVGECAQGVVSRERHVRVKRPPLGRGMLDLRVMVAPLNDDLFVVLVEDLSDERRVDAVRRDFVANVSHELKTPVGALSLLAEAIMSASDDSEAVRRFAERMMLESARLASLINDIIDLSRLQGDDPLAHAEVLEVDALVAQAVEEVRTLATSRRIEIVVSGDPAARMLGDRHQILMALRNLLTNAITYSEPETRIAVTARAGESVVEIDVKDQGIGIPSHDLDRIFERFYRVDQARSRGTGGTGLGLALVKHVCENHGGEVRVWSEVGVGSTFTLRLPLAATATTRVHVPGDDEGELVS